mmetsp:Transcript_14291/g.20926  ORF Transcript_14291/g.20926 Transcript_14291/m.20926 type:complete len:229 (-) Transcript_14291:1411-2097(-)
MSFDPSAAGVVPPKPTLRARRRLRLVDACTAPASISSLSSSPRRCERCWVRFRVPFAFAIFRALALRLVGASNSSSIVGGVDSSFAASVVATRSTCRIRCGPTCRRPTFSMMERSATASLSKLADAFSSFECLRWRPILCLRSFGAREIVPKSSSKSSNCSALVVLVDSIRVDCRSRPKLRRLCVVSISMVSKSSSIASSKSCAITCRCSGCIDWPRDLRWRRRLRVG